MKATSRLAPALLLAAVLPACENNNLDDQNPFAQNARTVPPASSAALIFTSNLYSLSPEAGREIFAVDADGGKLTRLTFCNDSAPCDYAEAAPAPDRERVGARRASVDTNGDGRVNELDGTALLFLDLRRGVEAGLIPASRFVSGVDWAPDSGDFFVYSGLPGGGGSEDLFLVEYNGQNDRNLTCPSDAVSQCVVAVRERRPRLDTLESVAAFQRVDAEGNSVVAIFSAVNNQPALTTGPNDFDPVFAPDTRRVAFRRLTDATANEGLGSWDIMSVGVDGTGLQVVASGPAYRGAPDWKANGMVWTEVDASGQRLVVANVDGTGPRTIVTLAANIILTNPRWLKAD